jgi:hypothetical protein
MKGDTNYGEVLKNPLKSRIKKIDRGKFNQTITFKNEEEMPTKSRMMISITSNVDARSPRDFKDFSSNHNGDQSIGTEKSFKLKFNKGTS